MLEDDVINLAQDILHRQYGAKGTNLKPEWFQITKCSYKSCVAHHYIGYLFTEGVQVKT